MSISLIIFWSNKKRRRLFSKILIEQDDVGFFFCISYNNDDTFEERCQTYNKKYGIIKYNVYEIKAKNAKNI